MQLIHFRDLARCGALAAALLTSSSVHGASPNFQCTVISSGEVILMRARFQVPKHKLRLFGAELQAKRSFGAGRRLSVHVEGVEIGRFKMKPIVGGDVAGELALNDAPLPGDHTRNFPPEFPPAHRGTKVDIRSDGKKVLGCALE
jgi:hypothetical protein